MAVNRNNGNQYNNYSAPRAPLMVGGYRGAHFITVNTTLPRDPRLVDTSRLPNGYRPVDYANMFARLPRELDTALRAKGHAEVSIAIDENGQMQRVNSGSANAPRTTYVSAMIKRNPDGSNSIVGIWGGTAGGGNNGAAAAMSTIKMMTTAQGRSALASSPLLETTQMQWGNSQLANTGTLNRNPLGWSYGNNGATTFIPYEQRNTYGVHKQDSLGEHHSRSPNTWGCTTGTEQSFLARTNSRISIMMGPNPPARHDWGSGLGLQNHPMNASAVFVRNKEVAASTLGPIYQLNPLMFDTGNTRYSNLASQLHVALPTPTALAAPRVEPAPVATFSMHRQTISHTVTQPAPHPQASATTITNTSTKWQMRSQA